MGLGYLSKQTVISFIEYTHCSRYIVYIVTTQEAIMSRTNVVLDDELVESCMGITGIKTKKSLIDFALRELLRKDKQKALLQLQGKINWEGSLQQMRQARFSE